MVDSRPQTIRYINTAEYGKEETAVDSTRLVLTCVFANTSRSRDRTWVDLRTLLCASIVAEDAFTSAKNFLDSSSKDTAISSRVVTALITAISW